MQNTVRLPQEVYEAVRQKAAAQQKTADALVTEWVSQHLEESETDEVVQAFQREVAAFERMRPALLEKYAGRYVAIYHGEVIASGDDKLALLDQVREQFGHVVCYIEKVTPDAPRTVRMPSFRIASS